MPHFRLKAAIRRYLVQPNKQTVNGEGCITAGNIEHGAQGEGNAWGSTCLIKPCLCTLRREDPTPQKKGNQSRFHALLKMVFIRGQFDEPNLRKSCCLPRLFFKASVQISGKNSTQVIKSRQRVVLACCLPQREHCQSKTTRPTWKGGGSRCGKENVAAARNESKSHPSYAAHLVYFRSSVEVSEREPNVTHS